MFKMNNSFKTMDSYSMFNIISKECIKPSTPTPLHLKTHKLSYLDQYINFPTYVQVVLFYHLNNPISVDENKQRSNLLKHSLSQTLTRFYPLAGKFIDNLSIDCNDQGVHYVESRVKSTMLEFLSQPPDNSLIYGFLPCNPRLDGSLTGAHVALVQANVFECGSIAVGFSFNHMLFDGVGLSAFLKCWSDIARGGFGHYPDFTTAFSLFPQNQAFPKGLSLTEMWNPFLKPGKVVTKRFVFDSSDIAKLKAKATNSLVQNPTRFEVVSALIWKCAVNAIRANSGIKKSSLLLFTVNLRQRTEQPISNNTMGNIFTVVLPRAEAETETNLDKLVDRIREAKKTLKTDPLKTCEGDKGFTNFCEYLKKTGDVLSSAWNSNNGPADFFGFSSWLNFGIYEVDFGWGKPEWVTASIVNQEEAPSMMNIVILNDTKYGNGVEAWVSLDEQDMTFLQCNEELLGFSSLDPSPLQALHLQEA